MNSEDMNSIFEQINNLKKPVFKSEKKTVDTSNNTLREILNGVSEEIQRVLEENNFTQEDLCQITSMSQSNISKILNGKVVPKIETLQKIASATHTRLVISFENFEGDD
ncbi:MAG: helix-turn-helix domain-containing protein [Lachnospiraceae bacterium]